MINKIKNVVILGAGGTMGSLTGGIVAQSGIKVYFLSRTIKHAEAGMKRAVGYARSEVIRQNIASGEYDYMLKEVLKEADWIVECISENIEIKQELYESIDHYKKPDAIVSSMTSSLPLSKLCRGRSEDFKKNFLGIHFYTPPAKLTACEIAPQVFTDPEVVQFMKGFLSHSLGRVVIPVRDTSAYAGNRIAFLLFSEVTFLALEYGVEMMDYLIGPYTGRIMAPLATIDLIGLDIYKAIIKNLYDYTNDHMHNSFNVPEYIEKMIANGYLGRKTPQELGFYRKDIHKNKFVINPITLEYTPIEKPEIAFIEEAKNMLHVGKYRDAFDIIKTSSCKEADIVRKILCIYIAYSYSCIGEVTYAQYGIDGIDEVMAFGYNWAPPSLIVSMLGGPKAVIELLQEHGLMVPQVFENVNKSMTLHHNPGRYFLAR